MNNSENIKLKGREPDVRLTRISTPIGGISWKPPVDERDKARRLLVYLAGQRALHYPYNDDRIERQKSASNGVKWEISDFIKLP
jgi:hypothetical protein